MTHIACILFAFGRLAPAATKDQVATPVGIEGVYYARCREPALEARPVNDRSAIVLRVAQAVRDGESTIYELRYIGTRPGSYDLRGFLQRTDGAPPAGLGPIRVAIEGRLPADHDGDLVPLPDPPLPAFPPYRKMLLAAAALWLAPGVVFLVWRTARRRRPPKVAASRPPSLADQLQPLLEAAAAGTLVPDEQARLERLLIQHWRQRLDLCGCSLAETRERMRGHPDAGLLLEQLETWLYRPPGAAAIDLRGILAPYRDQRPLTLEPQIAEEAK